VTIVARNQATLDQAAQDIGGNVQAISCDVTDKEALNATIEKAEKDFG
jgi:NADP-dependent 3-hydroxy acid dehydrogenase YdfG